MAKNTNNKNLRSGGNMSVGKKHWEQMKAEIERLTKMQDDHTKLRSDYSKLELFHGQLQEKYDKDIKLKDTTISLQLQRIEDLSKALADSGHQAAAINEDLKKQVIEATEIYLQRTWKFLEDRTDLVDATKEVVPYLPHPLTMEEDEFVTNYGQAVNKGLKNMRQNVQAECKKRAKGTWNIVILHGKLCLFSISSQ